MIPRFAVVAALSMLAVSAFAPASAGAAVPPPSGTWSCTITGSFAFTPPLSDTPSAGPVYVRTAGRGSNCNSAGVTGGKAPISDVFIRGRFAFSPGATCGVGLIDPGARHNLNVKFQGRNAKNHTMTVANSKVVMTSAALSFTDFNFAFLTPSTGAFANSSVHLNAAIDNPAQWGTECPTTGVRVITYTGTITVP
jgi:hypothetical protein